ncbi:MAG: isoprenoid biosynthesis glyoxalase ElbB [Candidatus Helarchaeota archaeon]|nr:isoprenoid biosynthesis glyoxalase ElbB [Candidatus Helarchaeota archaeon]
MPKVGVILSGSGVFDGSEIHEAVITLLTIEREGAEYVCMAPNINQMHTVNHITGDESKGEQRNVLVESARIARGNIKDVKDVSADEIDALIIPGGFGAAKNLCDFAVKGIDCEVSPDVKELVLNMSKAAKPIGAICIAPALLAKVFEGTDVKPTLTIGTDKQSAEAIEKMGAIHKDCPVDDIVVDYDNRIVTTPAYMLAKGISDAGSGIERLVEEIIDML